MRDEPVNGYFALMNILEEEVGPHEHYYPSYSSGDCSSVACLLPYKDRTSVAGYRRMMHISWTQNALY